uniref:Anosmin 1b n=1 Tax=Tetraodon nigroviridis TaxID=99883 RepID=H3DL85_TETNG
LLGVMSGRRAGLVLLCAALAVSHARRSSPEQEDVQEKIHSARCTSRCLTLHMTQLTAAFRHLQSDQVLDWCDSHRRCAQCLQPCKELWETKRILSPKSCEEHWLPQKQTECVTSREFLTSLRSSRQGDCPPPQRAAGFAAACVESCSSDQHCPSPRKCCSNGCGHTCQAPSNLYKGVPLKPRRDMNFEEDPEGHLKVTWVSKFNISMEPVVYILQSRWNIGIHPSEDHASPWTTVAMVLSEDVVLSDLRPQRWYQFRVAAINSHGSRGFTTPSKHYMSSKDPSAPEPPVNVRVSNQSRGSGVTVAVLLSWEPPREGDLPVRNYRVTWNPPHSRPVEQGKRESNARVTQGAQCELWLHGLLPASSYLLSVQTVAYWGQKRLKSPKLQMVFTTITQRGDLLETPSNPVTPGNLRLEVAAPHYHESQLQVKVFWKLPNQGKQRHPGPYVLRWRPHTCSTNASSTERTTTVQGTHHTITGLLFACKYRVSVAKRADPRSEAVAWVTTPACSSVRVRGGKGLPCSTEERLLSSRKALLRPERLSADFEQFNGTLLMTVRWRMSQQQLEPSAVEGFQFTWTLLSGVTATKEGIDDTLISQTQTVAATQRSVSVLGLRADSAYQLQLQVLTAGGSSGAAVSKTIHTP